MQTHQVSLKSGFEFEDGYGKPFEKSLKIHVKKKITFRCRLENWITVLKNTLNMQLLYFNSIQWLSFEIKK